MCWRCARFCYNLWATYLSPLSWLQLRDGQCLDCCYVSIVFKFSTFTNTLTSHCWRCACLYYKWWENCLSPLSMLKLRNGKPLTAVTFWSLLAFTNMLTSNCWRCACLCYKFWATCLSPLSWLKLRNGNILDCCSVFRLFVFYNIHKDIWRTKSVGVVRFVFKSVIQHARKLKIHKL